MGSTKYSTQVDIWGIGCIFAEMVTGRPLFCGSSDQDQLMKIFKIMGTPYRNEWIGLNDLPAAKDFDNYPRFEKKSLKQLLPRMNKLGLELLEVSREITESVKTIIQVKQTY